MFLAARLGSRGHRKELRGLAVRARGLLRSLLFGCCALLLGGCFPFAVPPARLRLALGPSVHGNLAERERVAPANDGEEEAPQPRLLNLYAGLHPTSLVKGAERARFDVGLGYTVEWLRLRGHEQASHGPAVELGYYPLQLSLDELQLRAGGLLLSELLVPMSSGEPAAFGSGVAAAVELSGFSDGPFTQNSSDDSGGFAAGYAYGQGAFGLFAGLMGRDLGGEPYWAATFGISGRLPFFGGIACCIWSSSSDDEDSWSTSGGSGGRVTRRRAAPTVTPRRTRATPTPSRR